MVTILRNMKKKGMSIPEIANFTGMPEDEVRHLI
jgi:hypothetical protein